MILGVGAARADEHSGKAAAWVSGGLLVGTAILLPILVINFNLGWALALVAVAAVLGYFEWRYRKTTPVT